MEEGMELIRATFLIGTLQGQPAPSTGVSAHPQATGPR